MKTMNRRQFLRLGALATAGWLTARCAGGAPGATPVSTATPEPITLDVGVSQPEYLEAYQKIWRRYETAHPGIRINLFAVNEDQFAAYKAKLKSGYLPAMEHTWATAISGVNQYNYQEFLDLGSIGFPWFDRWPYDVKNVWSDLYNLPGPRTLDIFQGFVFTWMYHPELMERAGLDPRQEVKTWDDLKRFLTEGAAWVKTQSDVDYFWDVSYHNLGLYGFFMDLIPMAFPDGGRERQRDCWLGKAKFNASDSPYRHTFNFFKEAQQKGWTPDGWWTRAWEDDMEASYIARRSVMMLHGHWPWDKMLAADPDAQQLGFPATPPAAGQPSWRQWMSQVRIDWGYAMREGVQYLPEWEHIKAAFFWWHSPEIVKLRAEAEGLPVVYKLDTPLELQSAQWQGVLKDIGGALWPDVVLETGLTGEAAAAPFRQEGSRGVWDWENDGFYGVWRDFMMGKLTTQEALDVAQANWAASYVGLPEG